MTACDGCDRDYNKEHKSYCAYYGSNSLYQPGWLEDTFKRAKYNIRNRETTAEQAWQEGFQAGLWYGKGGERTDNPYQLKESLEPND